MALFKISKGTAANLVANRPYAAEGNAYFTTDDGKFYIDISGDGSSTPATVGTNRIPLNAYQADKLSNPLYIDNGYFDGMNQKHVGNTVYYIEGNTTGTAGVWTGTCANITSLYPGLTIAYKVGIAGTSSGSGTSLNINDLGAVYIKINNGNFTTHVGVNTVIILVYDGTYWRWANYDSTISYRLTDYYGHYKAYTTLYRYQICLTKDETSVLPINTVSNSTATTKTLTTESFDPFGPIYYYTTTTTVSAGGNIGNNTLAYQYLADLRYSFNTGTTLVDRKAVYLVAIPGEGNSAILAPNPISQTLPSTDDGYIYIYLGQTYDNYRIELSVHHPIYQFKNGTVRIFSSNVAERVANNLTIKLNNGTTEGTNQFTYNGSVQKLINITPASIGALSASDAAAGAAKWITPRAFTIEDHDSSHTSTAVSVDGSADVSLKLPSTIKATLEGLASQASSTVGTLTIKLNSGTTEGTNQFTYNGSNNKSIDITPNSIGALGVNATAAAATKLATPRSFVIKDSDETNTGTSVNFDGTANVTLKLPSTIKATLTGTATQVSSVLTIKLNGGTTEGTNQFTYNGSALKTIDITPSSIGAVSKGGDTMTGDLTLAVSDNSASPALIFLRGTATDSYDDIKLYDDAGKLVVAHRSGSSTWTNLFTFDVSANTTTQNLIPSTNGTLSLGASDHLWSTVYATTFSGNATSATKVNNPLTIKLNGGETEGTNQFTYDGSAIKNINITPASIGALSISDAAAGAAKWSTPRNFTISDSTSAHTGTTTAVDGSAAVDLKLPATITATLEGNAATATKVNNTLTIKLNSGTTEDTNQFTYNGSAGKSVNITPSAIGALATSGTAVAANRLTSADTRSTASKPQTTPNGLTANFKSNATNGLADGGNYNGVISWRSYPTAASGGTDFSGGYPIEIAYTANGNVWTRMGTGNESWSAWKQLAYTSSNITGNAATATKVNNPLTIKLNGGETEGTNQFTYDGSAIKNINITPASIGALSASDAAAGAAKWSTPRDFTISDSTSAHTGVATSVDGSTNVDLKLPATITATLIGNASTATQVSQPLTIKLNGGTTEDTNQFTYNGSTLKTIDVTPAAIGAVALIGSTMTGNLLANSTANLGSAANPWHRLTLGGATTATMTASSTNPGIVFQDGTGTQPVYLIYTDYDSYRSPAGLKVVGGTGATPAWFEVEGKAYASEFVGPLNGNAATATKVNNTLTVRVNGGITEDTDQITYDGHVNKSIDIATSTITIRRWVA